MIEWQIGNWVSFHDLRDVDGTLWVDQKRMITIRPGKKKKKKAR